MANFINTYAELYARCIEYSFITDLEKMKDFYFLSKDEFLKSYNYISEFEYEITNELIKSFRQEKGCFFC